MTDSSSQAFGTVLRQFRREMGLTQEKLAERAGLSARTVSDLERGLKATPQASTLDMLCEALSLSTEARDVLRAAAPKRRRKIELETASPRSSTIPAELTSLVGREKDEASAVHILMDKRARLLTLIGTGGVGKTRLAVRVAATLASSYRDGARFISLAACSNPARLATWIGMSLDLKEDPSRSAEDNLCSWLRDREMLLVLDNFEHLMAAAPVVSAILEACPRVTLLTTSRSPLRLRAEHLLDVPALESPPATDTPRAQQAIGYSGIALFVQRAQAAQSGFELTDELVDPVAEICRRLDNLPLAIELVAAQTRRMPAHALLALLDEGLEAIPPGPIDAPPRHRTVEAAIAWSYDLLEPPERLLFRGLSVFVGGFTVEAAEAVNGADAHALLDSLVDKNLVFAQSDRVPRFSMLETVREYSRNQADVEAETEQLRDRHALFFSGLARVAGRAERESGAEAWSTRLLEDHDNFLTALRWLAERDRVHEALLLATGMIEYWIFWGYVRLGRAWMERLLELSEKEGIRAPAQALAGTARLAWLQNDYAKAATMYEVALEAHRLEGNQKELPVILNNLGTVAHLQNDYDRAELYYLQAIDDASAVDAKGAMGMSLTNLGIIASQRGDYQRAAEFLDRGLDIWREMGHDQRLAVTLGNRGSLAFRLGNYDEAVALHDEALARKRELGDKLSIAYSAGDYGIAEIERGNLDQAEALLREALGIFEENGQKDGVAESIEALARISHLHNEYGTAAGLYGGADALRTAIGVSRHPADRQRYERCLKEVRDSMAEGDFQASWTAGEKMPLEDLVRLAISDLAQPAPRIGM